MNNRFIDPGLVIERALVVSLLMCLLLLLLLISTSVKASDDDQTATLRVNARFDKERTVAVTEQLKIIVEIASVDAFTGSSRIHWSDTPGLIIQQKEAFSTSYSRIESGISWHIQQWELVVYAKAEGDYQVAPLQITAFLRNQEQGDYQAQLQSSALTMQAIIPEPMRLDKHWFAASDFDLEQAIDYEQDDDEVLKPGDAIQRELTMQAEDSVAMLLPQLAFSAFEGMSVYQKPTSSTDKVNRGSYIAEKRLRADYFIAEDGLYRFPEISLAWWNSDTQSREISTIASLDVQVGTNTQLKARIAPVDIALQPVTWWVYMLGLVMLVLLSLFIRWAYGYYQQPESIQRRKTRCLLIQVLAEKDSERQLALCYHYLDICQPRHYDHQIRQLLHHADDINMDAALLTEFESLMIAIYAGGQEKSGSADHVGAKFYRRLLTLRRHHQAKAGASALSLNPTSGNRKC